MRIQINLFDHELLILGRKRQPGPEVFILNEVEKGMVDRDVIRRAMDSISNYR